MGPARRRGLLWAEPGGYTRASLGGAIAQLGERLNGIQEVAGSTPVGSTSGSPSMSLAAKNGTAWRYDALPPDEYHRRYTGKPRFDEPSALGYMYRSVGGAS